MEKQSKETIRSATGWSGREFLTNMERLVNATVGSDCALAKLESESAEEATNGVDSHSDESAPEISIEDVQLFRTRPYMGFTAGKLHAIYEQYGHVRDIADTLAGHGLCQPETLVGLYELYRYDVSFVKSLLQQWQKLPENLLQRILMEHGLEPLANQRNDS